MRCFLTILTGVAILGGGLVAAWAEDSAPATPPGDAKKVDAKADAATPAQLRAKLHRTLADLIDAQNAEKPDQAQVDKLTKEVEQLRAQTVGQRVSVQVAWRCPRGGPGMGYGRGYGPGRGPGMGGGRGPGQGRGLGMGAGFIDRNQNGVCDNLEGVAGQK